MHAPTRTISASAAVLPKMLVSQVSDLPKRGPVTVFLSWKADPLFIRPHQDAVKQGVEVRHDQKPSGSGAEAESHGLPDAS